MALKDLFTMVKSDRYTQDGRDQLIKAQEVETEDRTYNIGEISEKTGLQKTANGWVKPKKSGKITPKGKDLMERAARNPKLSEHGRAAASKLAKEYGEKLSGSNGSESTSAGGAEKHAKAMENAKKVGIVSKVPEGWKKAEGVTTAPNGYVAITNGGSHFPKEGQQKKEIKFIKEEDFNKGNTQSAKFDEYGLPSNETIAMKDKFLKEENVADPSKLTNKEFNALAEKLDKKLGINNKERAQELLVAESEQSKPAGSGVAIQGSNWFSLPSGTRITHEGAREKLSQNNERIETIKKMMEGKSKADNFRLGAELKSLQNENEFIESRLPPENKPAAPKAPKPSVQEYMKAQDTVKKYEETYKKQLEEYENGQRLRANGGGAILDPMYGLKPNDLSKNADYMKAKDIIQRMEAEDAAPRILTGDTRIRIRK